MTGTKKKRGGAAKNEISVRMYNVGFGDCFLIRIPMEDGERRMLVDCGFHSQGKGDFSDQELVEQIKEDLNGEGLHVVIATHRHQDHISGFGEKDLWADVSVEEVWLPFTVNPESAQDEPALRAWQGLMGAAAALCDANGVLTPAAVATLGSRDPIEQAAVAFMLWNARSNEPAIDNLLRGFKRADGRPSTRRFLPEKGDYPTSFGTPVLPKVKMHVLGPPTDPAMRKSKKVPSTWAFDAAVTGTPGGFARLAVFRGLARAARNAFGAAAVPRQIPRGDPALQRRPAVRRERARRLPQWREPRARSRDRPRTLAVAR